MKKSITAMVLTIVMAACQPGGMQSVSVTEAALPTAAISETASPGPSTPVATPSAMATTPVPWVTMEFSITPNPVQLERWREYEKALAGRLKSSSPIEKVLCEWEILGQADLEVYVWAKCAGPIGSEETVGTVDIPAVIHLGRDGSVQAVDIPGSGTLYAPDIRKLFPPDVQDKIFNKQINLHQLGEHLNWRLDHPDEPPLIVLSATPAP